MTFPVDPVVREWAMAHGVIDYGRIRHDQEVAAMLQTQQRVTHEAQAAAAEHKRKAAFLLLLATS